MNILDKLLQHIKVKQKPLWSPEVFYYYLKTIVTIREKLNFTGDHILKYTPNKNDKFIIFGDIQGAFHSLIRDLEELKKQEFITEDLKIKETNTYIIINGDLINRSAYVMETLTIVLRLMIVNPEKIIYICGNHEDNETWRGFQLNQELIYKAPQLHSNDMPTDILLTRFFATLPLALYIKKDNDFIRISHFKGNQKGLDERNFGQFLKKDEIPGNFSILKLNEQIMEKETVIIAVSIFGENHTSYHQITDGLELLFSDRGSTSWNIMSAPTSVFQKLFGFYNDTFVILDLGSTINVSTLTLNYQDARHLNGFKTKTFHAIYGVELTKTNGQKIVHTKEEIVIGCTLDLSKTSAVLGRRIREGLHVGILEANYSNLIGDKFIKLVVLDDGYTPHLAKRNALRLLEDYKANILLSSVGTPTTEAIFPLIQEEKILMLFPFTGSRMFRKKELTHFIHYRPALQKESFALTQFAVTFLDQRKIAFFYQNDAYGLACLEGAKKALDECNIHDFIEAPYERNSLNVDFAAEKIMNFGPNAIMFFGTTAPSIALIKKLGVENLFEKLFLGISFLTDVFRYFLRSKGLELIITRIVPNINSDLEIAQDYRNAIAKYSPTSILSADSFEGYIHSKFLEEFLRNIKGSVTKEKIIEQFEKLKDYPFKGMNLNFNPETRELLTDVWADLGKGPWVKIG